MFASNRIPFCQGCGLAFDTDIRLRWHQSQPRSACHRFYSGHDDELDRLIQAGEALVQRRYLNENVGQNIQTNIASLPHGLMDDDSHEQIGTGVGAPFSPDGDIPRTFSGDYGSPNEHGNGNEIDVPGQEQNFGESLDFDWRDMILNVSITGEEDHYSPRRRENSEEPQALIRFHSNQASTYGRGPTILDRFNDDENSEYRTEFPYYPFKNFAEWQFASTLDRLNVSLPKLDSIFDTELVCSNGQIIEICADRQASRSAL